MGKWDNLDLRKTYPDLFSNPNLGDNICLLVVGGSHAYGLANENSDIDIRGVALRSTTELLGFRTFDGFTSITEDRDISIYTLDKFIYLALKGNPAALEILFTDDEDVLICNKYGDILRKNRQMFLSNNIYKPFAGTIRSHLKTYEKTENVKFLRHAARLTAMSYELFKHGKFIVKIEELQLYNIILQTLMCDSMQKKGINSMMLYCDSLLNDNFDNSILNDKPNEIMVDSLLIRINKLNLREQLDITGN